MPAGDAASAAGYPVVPESGSDNARVRYGAREINVTRDLIAALKNIIPVSKAGFRTSSGISTGTANPSGGVDGDIYFKII